MAANVVTISTNDPRLSTKGSFRVRMTWTMSV